MRVAVKYCGGCNPDINREKLVERLAIYLGSEIRPLKADEWPDVVLVVNGCARSCAAGEDLPGAFRIVVAGRSVDSWPMEEEEIIKYIKDKIPAR